MTRRFKTLLCVICLFVNFLLNKCQTSVKFGIVPSIERLAVSLKIILFVKPRLCKSLVSQQRCPKSAITKTKIFSGVIFFSFFFMEKVQVKLDKCYTVELATQNIWESITQRFTYRPIDFDTQLALHLLKKPKVAKKCFITFPK